MNRQYLQCMAVVLLFLAMAMQIKADGVASYAIIPKPQSVALSGGGHFELNKSTRIVCNPQDKDLSRVARMLSQYIKESTGMELSVSDQIRSGNRISLSMDDKSVPAEGYRMRVDQKGVSLTGSSAAGLFYGVQALRKSLPLDGGKVSMPYVSIYDYPRMQWRGLHLDEGRHFFGMAFVKDYIDIMALHNLNVFHWHLTEDQGWRIEIKKYPKLTEIGSKRNQSLVEDGTDKHGDGTPYGGFYTQDQIREIIQYAADRFITIVPEIDMPGHTVAALASYPELGCTGGPYEVEYHYGVFKDVLCVGNPKAIEFAKDVLEEVMDLFPSHYIHIGGDESPRDRWKTCDKCQALIRKMGWTATKERSAEAQLQTYFLGEMEKVVNARGRSLIGWDEILEGGLTGDVTVMSWRNAEYGIKAAKLGHDVIMTPVSFMYMSARSNAELPGTQGLRRVYDFEPLPDTLSADIKRHIIGAQCCLWSEHILNHERAEYLILPRITALSEIVWNGKRDFDEFLTRVTAILPLYDRLGYVYQRHIFDIVPTFTADPVQHALSVTLQAANHTPFHYTIDGSKPSKSSPRYTKPLLIDKSCLLQAQVLDGADTSAIFRERIDVNKATFHKGMLKEPTHKNYQAEGALTLCDGLHGDLNFTSGRWLGFLGKDMDLRLDLEKEQTISSVKVTTLVNKGDAIFAATRIELWISDNGTDYRILSEQSLPEMTKDTANGIHELSLTCTPVQGRYFRVVLKGTPTLPEWSIAPGTPGFLFVDEVQLQ